MQRVTAYGYRNRFNKRAPEILAQLFGEFAVAMVTALSNAIFPKIAFERPSCSCHGGLQRGALGHPAQNIGPK